MSVSGASCIRLTCRKRWRLESGKQSNYFRCDLCHFEYAFRRTRYANILNSKYTQSGLTISILTGTVYIAGFVSRPFVSNYYDEVPGGQNLIEHMTIGLLGIGVLGFYRMWFTGNSIYIGGRRRESAGSFVTWVVVALGLYNVGKYIWNQVQKATKRFLTRMADDILEVQ